MVKADSKAVPKVSLAGAVVPIAASLMHMTTDIAVQDSHNHVVIMVD
jgi:hypothetical protein